MKKRCLQARLHISVVWVNDCGRYGLEKLLAVNVAICTCKCMWSCQLRRWWLCQYVYTSMNRIYVVQSYVCNANICTVKLKIFLRRESARVRSLNLYPQGEPEGNEKKEPLEERSVKRRTTPCQVRILAQTVGTPEFLTPRRQFEQERE